MSELDNLAGGIVAVGVGGAAAAAIEPVLEPARQAAWAESLAKVLDVESLARLVAQALITEPDAQSEAARTGYNHNKLAAYIQLAMTAPPVSEAFDLRRRNKIDDAQFEHALAKAQIEPQYWPALKDLVDERLTPQQIALAIVRSLMKDPGFLPVTLDVTGGRVPAYTQSTIDPVTEAATSGIDKERLRVMVGEIGLPMSLQAAASAVFRDIIKREDFNRAVLEGDTRPEWADAIFRQARQIPAVSDYVAAYLKGWITEQDMHDGAALHGMTAADADLIFKRSGRPAAPGQMAKAAAQGVDGPDKVPMDRDQFLKGIRESDIRPEWGPMLWDSRHNFPPLFQINRLVQAGAITPDVALSWAEKDNYHPDVIAALSTYWRAGTTAAENAYVKRAETQLWTNLHRSFVNFESVESTAREGLTILNVPTAAQDTIIFLWTAERDLVDKTLTPTQIKKAWKGGVDNPATGAPWTEAEALARLIDLGYSQNDATTFLHT